VKHAAYLLTAEPELDASYVARWSRKPLRSRTAIDVVDSRCSPTSVTPEDQVDELERLTEQLAQLNAQLREIERQRNLIWLRQQYLEAQVLGGGPVQSLTDKVMNFIYDRAGRELTAEEIAVGIQAQNLRSIRTLLCRLATSGKIKRPGRGRYTANKL
jgi:ATP-dependent Clp protease ATP-binding subunit ClpA